MNNSFRKNLSYNLIFTVLSTLSTFLLMKYLFLYFNNDKNDYGLWLIVFSILSYIYIMDFGISNGLRNIITPLINNDKTKMNMYISNTYSLMAIISLFLIIICNITIYFVPFDFMKSLNGFNLNIQQFKEFFVILLNLQILYFFISCMKPVFHAFSKSYLVNLAQFLSNIITIFIILILTKYQLNDRWDVLAYIYIGPQVIVIAAISYYILKKYNLTFLPSFDLIVVKELFSFGIKFLFLQVSNLILFNSLPIIIGLVVTLTEASQFQLSYKLLSMFLMVFTIMMAPIWTLLLHENEKKNYEGILAIFYKLFAVVGIITVLMLIFGVFQNRIILIWMGKDFHITLFLSLLMCIYMMFNIICAVMQSLLNGLNIFNSQIIGYISGSIYLIISAIVIKLLGITDLKIVLVNGVISLLIPSLIMLISFRKFIRLKLNKH